MVSKIVRARFVLEWLLLRLTVRIMPWLPHGLLKLMAMPLGRLGYWIDYRGRSAALQNLGCVFPGKSASDVRKLAKKSYHRFALTFMELFWGRNLTKENAARFYEIDYASEATKQAIERGCVFATLHAGNFEWLSRGTALSGFPSMIVAANFLNPRLNATFRELRQAEGHVIIPQEMAIVKLFKHLKRGGRTAMLVDLNVAPDQSATVIDCFGKLTCVTMAHAALAQRTGSPLVPAISVPRSDGKYAFHFLEPIPVGPGDSMQEITQRCWKCFESFILEQPEIWIWMYKHWRYLPDGAAVSDYPAYANRSKKFDKLAAKEARIAQPRE